MSSLKEYIEITYITLLAKDELESIMIIITHYTEKQQQRNEGKENDITTFYQTGYKL